MNTYTFEKKAQAFCLVRVEAESEDAARQMVHASLGQTSPILTDDQSAELELVGVSSKA